MAAPRADRRDCSIVSGRERLAAWLYEPDAPRPHPCVVMAHGLGGVREARLDAYAERFAAAGIAALVFDYRHLGASTGEPRQLIDIDAQKDDWRAALGHARGLRSLDRNRLALWGTSLAGGHVIELAAEQPELAAVVAQCPMADGLAALRAIEARRLIGLTAAGLRDEWAQIRGRGPVYLPLVGPPGSLAAMTGDDAERGYAAIVPEASAWQNCYAARFGLRFGRYRPVRSARRVRAPLLVCACERDTITPPQPAVRAAELAPRGELRRYDCAHFDIYVGEVFEQAVADQVEFLKRHLL